MIKAPKLLREYPERVLLGRHDGEDYYLVAPTWDCGWYWSFGYLQDLKGRNFRTHLDSELNKYSKNWKEALDDMFGNNITIPRGEFNFLYNDWRLWLFVEIAKSIYLHKEMAEVLNRGGCHIANNPHKELITDHDKVDYINYTVIPALVDTLYVALGVVEPLHNVDYGTGWREENEYYRKRVAEMQNI